MDKSKKQDDRIPVNTLSSFCRKKKYKKLSFVPENGEFSWEFFASEFGALVRDEQLFFSNIELMRYCELMPPSVIKSLKEQAFVLEKLPKNKFDKEYVHSSVDDGHHSVWYTVIDQNPAYYYEEHHKNILRLSRWIVQKLIEDLDAELVDKSDGEVLVDVTDLDKPDDWLYQGFTGSGNGFVLYTKDVYMTESDLIKQRVIYFDAHSSMPPLELEEALSTFFKIEKGLKRNIRVCNYAKESREALLPNHVWDQVKSVAFVCKNCEDNFITKDIKLVANIYKAANIKFEESGGSIKIVSPSVEAEIFKEELDMLRKRNAELEEQLRDFNPQAPFEAKVLEWLQEGEGRIIYEDTRAFIKGMQAERAAHIAKWNAKFREMKEKHKPMLERFQKLTGASFDIRPLFGDLLDRDDE